MDVGLVRLLWEVDSSGYDIVRRRDMRDPAAEKVFEWAKTHDDAQFIVPRGGKSKTYEAGLTQHSIFLDLASSARLSGPEGVREFVNKWGQLQKDWFAPLAYFISYRDALVRATSFRHDDVTRLLGVVSASLGPKLPYDVGSLRVRYSARIPKLYLQASTLLQFCALELLQARDGKIDLTACGVCGMLLPIHKKGRPKRYCDDACRMVAHRAKHRDEQRGAGGHERREGAARKRGAT